MAAIEGKIVGEKYCMGKLLGHGTSGQVHRATLLDPARAGEVCAVKILSRAHIAQRNHTTHVNREISILKRLRHVNVVSLSEVLMSSNNFYLFMELVDGGTLHEKLRCEPPGQDRIRKFSEPVARRYFHQLVVGLRYCHGQGVAHRDLKPTNLLLDHNNVLKISDFGLANLQPDDGSGLRTQCGTPHYVAPEVISGEAYNGFKADVWSCGVILYVMLTGCLPFDDPGIRSRQYEPLWRKIRSASFAEPSAISAEANDLVKCLIVEERSRLSIDDILAHPWFQESFVPSALDSGECLEDKHEPAIEDTTDRDPQFTIDQTVAEYIKKQQPKIDAVKFDALLADENPQVRRFTHTSPVEDAYRGMFTVLQGLQLRPKITQTTTIRALAPPPTPFRLQVDFYETTDPTLPQTVVELRAEDGDGRAEVLDKLARDFKERV